MENKERSLPSCGPLNRAQAGMPGVMIHLPHSLPASRLPRCNSGSWFRAVISDNVQLAPNPNAGVGDFNDELSEWLAVLKIIQK